MLKGTPVRGLAPDSSALSGYPRMHQTPLPLSTGHFGKIYALQWAADSKHLVSAAQDGKLYVSFIRRAATTRTTQGTLAAT